MANEQNLQFRTLINCAQLADALAANDSGASNVRVVDCRFDLGDIEAGRRAYAHSHIPGAAYAHLDEDMSGPIVPGRTGRHPLPDAPVFAATVARLGISNHAQVALYDDSGGSMAARMWWMLRWIGLPGRRRSRRRLERLDCRRPSHQQRRRNAASRQLHRQSPPRTGRRRH